MTEATTPRNKFLFPLIVLGICLVLAGYIFWNQYGSSKYPQGADFSYTNLNGETVTLKNTNGDVRVLYFFFSYCPDVCPPTTYLLSQVQDELKKDGLFGSKVKFLSVTIDPTRDTQERLKEFSSQFDADYSGWEFLRGEEQETFELANKYQIFASKDAEGNFGHSNLLILLDKKGKIRDWISANDYFMYGKDNKPISDVVQKIKDLV